MATVNAPASSARLGSQVLIATEVAIVFTVLLTLLMTVQQRSMSMGDQTPRIPIASIFVDGLIFWSPWVVLAPAITLLGWYQRLGTGNLARRAHPCGGRRQRHRRRTSLGRLAAHRHYR
ncbi:MAG TPA: hypothetical protein VNV25_10245 [Gemmatimonadaceae bacterium]|jgi:hypothetical protein|nr:hypothetical protein [Gemmatimonadaceae bacterium]